MITKSSLGSTDTPICYSPKKNSAYFTGKYKALSGFHAPKFDLKVVTSV